MLTQEQLWWLASVTVTPEEELHARRLGYWLRRVRERRGESLKSAAIAAGLKASSGSTVSMWEHGKRPIKVSVLRRLARFYDVPDALFIDPPMTDEERLEVALADAVALEQEDWGSEPDLGLGAAGERAGERDRRLQ